MSKKQSKKGKRFIFGSRNKVKNLYNTNQKLKEWADRIRKWRAEPYHQAKNFFKLEKRAKIIPC
ncbi:MAG: hypothetical protein Athens101410_77 [Parcubacteria group bacterium Athens1014_10]|nr:MAG: hypothetical protein Athens101410_77 [Parcubacteria group bacterium Athens1014_10]TSD06103.1 MAG: hypothetical protein Athens071412_77 [Parcubacteria group bacterium Athens0714_12]